MFRKNKNNPKNDRLKLTDDPLDLVKELAPELAEEVEAELQKLANEEISEKDKAEAERLLKEMGW